MQKVISMTCRARIELQINNLKINNIEYQLHFFVDRVLELLYLFENDDSIDHQLIEESFRIQEEKSVSMSRKVF